MDASALEDGSIHRPDNRFIPVRVEALAEAIADDPGRFGAVSAHVHELADAFDAVIDQEVTALGRWLDRLYASLNPDADTLPPGAEIEPGEEAGHAEARLLGALRYALDQANFAELDGVQIDQAIRAASSYGVRVRVDHGRVEHLSLHVRGVGLETRVRRRWSRPWRRETRTLRTYRRLVVAVRLQDEPGVRLKLFRDIPVVDVEALLPHAEVTMSVFDRIQIVGGGAGALGGVGFKVFAFVTTGALVFTKLLVPLVIGLGGLAFKSFLGYRRTKHMRTSQRTHHLYDKNIANNAAALDALLRMIAHEEVKEGLLAYAFLASPEPPVGGGEGLGAGVGRWLEAAFGAPVDFDWPDALETLDRLGLWADRDSWRVVGAGEALALLREHWESRRSGAYHVTAAGGGRATRPGGA